MQRNCGDPRREQTDQTGKIIENLYRICKAACGRRLHTPDIIEKYREINACFFLKQVLYLTLTHEE